MLFFSNIAQRLFSTPKLGSTFIQSRTKVIYHLPKPTETKRVRKQGYITRVRTPIGRKYMMTRILRGDKIVAQ